MGLSCHFAAWLISRVWEYFSALVISETIQKLFHLTRREPRTSSGSGEELLSHIPISRRRLVLGGAQGGGDRYRILARSSEPAASAGDSGGASRESAVAEFSARASAAGRKLQVQPGASTGVLVPGVLQVMGHGDILTGNSISVTAAQLV